MSIDNYLYEIFGLGSFIFYIILFVICTLVSTFFLFLIRKQCPNSDFIGSVHIISLLALCVGAVAMIISGPLSQTDRFSDIISNNSKFELLNKQDRVLVKNCISSIVNNEYKSNGIVSYINLKYCLIKQNEQNKLSDEKAQLENESFKKDLIDKHLKIENNNEKTK